MPNALATSITSHAAYVVDLGANDALFYGIGPNEALFDLCHSAALTWLGVPRENKVLVGDPGVEIQSGNWTTAGPSVVCCVGALTNASGSGTVQYQFETNGGSAYLWYQLQSNAAGSFTISVDGVPSGVSTSTLFPASAEALAGSYAVLRIPVSAGTHRFQLTAQSGLVSILGMGTAPAASSMPPTVFSTDVPNNPDPQYAAAIAEFNLDMAKQIALLTADGLDIRLVPTDKFYLATPPEINNINHPNALGLAEFAQAVESTITPATPVAGSISVAGAAYTTTTLPIGGHAISVSYSGDSKYAPATVGLPWLVLYDGTSTTTLAAGATPVSPQIPLTLTATIPEADQDGLVTFIDTSGGSNTVVGQSWLNGQTAQLTVQGLSLGQHTLIAQFAGDLQVNGSISPAISVTASPAITTTALSANGTRYDAGAPVALSAAVSPATATGSVTFLDGASVLAQVPVVSGLVSFSTSALAPGIHSIIASYSGDSLDTTSASAPVAITVNFIASTIALANPAGTIYIGGPLALTASITPKSATGTVSSRDAVVGTLGQTDVAQGSATLTLPKPALGAYSITASYSGDTEDAAAISNTVSTQVVLNTTALAITSSANPITVAAPVTLAATLSSASATGTVAFLDGSTAIGTAPFANGKAAFSTSSLAPGSHILHATYSGDTLYAASTSTTLTETVNTDPTVTSLSLAQTSVTVGSTITFNVQVSDANATPTGTVLIRSGAVTLASVPLASITVGSGYATLSINSTTLGIGTFPIVASYSGDANDQPSASSANAVTVTGDPTTATVTLSSAQIPILGATTITVNVASANATPTGSITFLSNGTTLTTTPLNSVGTASYRLTGNTMGSFAMTAVYTPTGLFASTSIAPATLVVTAPLSIALNPASISASPGTTASATVTFTPLSGFTGAIQTACQTTVGFVTCSLSAPATINGQTTVPVQVSVSKSDIALAVLRHPGTLAATLALMLPLLLLRRLKPALAILCFLPFALLLSGCAEGGDFNSIPPGAQTVAITITAAGIADTTNLTVNVQ